jgi:hypothetical protein
MTSRRLLFAVILLVVGVLGLALYVWSIVRKVRQPAPAVVDTRPVAPPVSGIPTAVVLFLADDADGTLHQQTASVVLPAEPAKRGREILRALVAQYQENASPHPLGAGADITEVYLVKGNLAVVDANGIFADGHRSGILVEELTLASLAKTLAANLPGITSMKLLVDGKERATLAGHAGLTEPYSVAGASRLVR